MDELPRVAGSGVADILGFDDPSGGTSPVGVLLREDHHPDFGDLPDLLAGPVRPAFFLLRNELLPGAVELHVVDDLRDVLSSTGGLLAGGGPRAGSCPADAPLGVPNVVAGAVGLLPPLPELPPLVPLRPLSPPVGLLADVGAGAGGHDPLFASTPPDDVRLLGVAFLSVFVMFIMAVVDIGRTLSRGCRRRRASSVRLRPRTAFDLLQVIFARRRPRNASRRTTASSGAGW